MKKTENWMSRYMAARSQTERFAGAVMALTILLVLVTVISRIAVR